MNDKYISFHVDFYVFKFLYCNNIRINKVKLKMPANILGS